MTMLPSTLSNSTVTAGTRRLSTARVTITRPVSAGGCVGGGVCCGTPACGSGVAAVESGLQRIRSDRAATRLMVSPSLLEDLGRDKRSPPGTAQERVVLG